MKKSGTYKFQPKTLDHVHAHVRDREKVIETWEGMLGLGPWFAGGLAFAYMDNGVELAVHQHREGMEEGVHHLGFNVDDLEGETANLVAQGAKVTAQGTGWVYLDCGTGVIIELIKERGKITD